MPKFIIELDPELEQPFLIKLVKEHAGVAIYLRQGYSENLRVLKFHDDGKVMYNVHQVEKFGLRPIIGTI